MRLAWVIPCLLALPAVASPVDDDFADGVTAPWWSVLEDSPSTLRLAEQNGRLEVLASDPPNATIDALYLSNGTPGGRGFALATDADFEIAVRYRLGALAGVGAVGEAFGLVFGVGRDLDGTDAAAIGYGVTNVGLVVRALTVGTRTDDAQTTTVLGGGATAGTFVITYDALGDDLTLGNGTLSFTLADTVRAVWGAEELLVSMGARGAGFSTVGAEAWFDDFEVRQGNVRAYAVIPEPASWIALGGVCMGFFRGRRRRS